MLIKDFYKVDIFNFDGNNLTATITLNPLHDIYKGHFPDQPVVPGVMQLQIVRELIEKQINAKVNVFKVKQIKYLIPVLPDVNNKLDLIIDLKEDDQINAVFKVRCNESVFTKGSVILLRS